MIRSKAITAVTLFLISTMVAPACDVSGGEDDYASDLLNEIMGAHIMSTVLHLQSFLTREFHTGYSRDAAQYILDEMEAIGLKAHTQPFEVDGTPVVNVVGVLDAGTEANGTILVGAHYDSENYLVDTLSEAENFSAPGADDNGSGVGVMLELARVLSQTSRFSATIKFVAFGAEEKGYDRSGGTKGSAAFVKAEVEAGVSYDAAFVLDMVGYNATDENRATLICNDSSAMLAQVTSEAAAEHGADVYLRTVLNENFTYSDHASFWQAGYQSILLIEEVNSTTGMPVNPYYHSSQDTAEKLSEELMTEVAKTVLAAIINLTDQGEDSYSTEYFGAVAATLVIAAAVVTIVLLMKRKMEI